MPFDRETCDNCEVAAQRLWHGFTGGCKGCCARAVARSPQYFAAQQAGKITPDYRRLLQQFELQHEEAKAARAADFEARAAA